MNWFTPSDITAADGIFLDDSGDKCTDEGFRESSAKMFPAYSVMMTSRATIGAIGINLTPACTNQGCITCIPKERYPLPFLYHWLKLGKAHFEPLSVGATFAELTKGTFKKIPVLTPPQPIVDEFAKIEAPLFQQIENLLRHNAALQRTRDLLHALHGLGDREALLGHPKLGASWEGFVIEQLIALLATRDSYFWGTHAGAELDFMSVWSGRRYGFEVKYADAPGATKSMHIALADLGLAHLWVIYPGEKRYDLTEKITVIPAHEIPALVAGLKAGTVLRG